jgi:hypothetical protein
MEEEPLHISNPEFHIKQRAVHLYFTFITTGLLSKTSMMRLKNSNIPSNVTGGFIHTCKYFQ